MDLLKIFGWMALNYLEETVSMAKNFKSSLSLGTQSVKNKGKLLLLWGLEVYENSAAFLLHLTVNSGIFQVKRHKKCLGCHFQLFQCQAFSVLLALIVIQIAN